MEIEEDTSLSPKMEEHRRYMRLHAIVHDINSGSATRTPEWYVEHNYLLCMYESFFKSGFSGIHPSIDNPRFRKNCSTLDALIDKLMKEFNHYHWFSLITYLEFNKCLIDVIDEACDHEETELMDEDFSSIFSTLKV